MGISAWLSIAALVFASASAVIALLKEKRNRWQRNALFCLASLGCIVGIVLIWQTEQRHQKERQADREQIAGLNQSVETQIRNNETQYRRNIDEIHRLQGQLTELEKHVATEELRKKMDALRTQLDKALMPAPKAKLEPGFWLTEDQGQVVTEMYAPVQDNVVTFSFSVVNHSDVNVKNGSLWLRICLACKYAKEPLGFEHVLGAPDFERLLKFGDLPAGARLQKMTVDVQLPSGSLGGKLPVFVSCRCDNCEIEKDHLLLITLGRLPFPHRQK